VFSGCLYSLLCPKLFTCDRVSQSYNHNAFTKTKETAGTVVMDVRVLLTAIATVLLVVLCHAASDADQAVHIVGEWSRLILYRCCYMYIALRNGEAWLVEFSHVTSDLNKYHLLHTLTGQTVKNFFRSRPNNDLGLNIHNF